MSEYTTPSGIHVGSKPIPDIKHLWLGKNSYKAELLIKRYKDEHDEDKDPSYLELTKYYIHLLETKLSDIHLLVGDKIICILKVIELFHPITILKLPCFNLDCLLYK